jgi:hypothetical protein
MPKYDLAFSFLKVDLPLARRLAEAVDPLVSFVYADRQDEIILQDGMDVFGHVFAEESRLNVVLHRTEYGHQGWTSFEQQIIKARCLGNEGWTSFALLQVDDTPVPSWVPPTYIYGDANMGVDVLAGVLKHRAKMVGANVANETAASRLARLANKKAFDADTEQLATGPEAHAALRSNLDRVFQ